MTPARINFKMYQGSTFEQPLRWESGTKIYLPITAITKSAPVSVTVSDPSKVPPIGWRVRFTNIAGMKELNSAEGVYYTLTDSVGGTLYFNQINSLGYSQYTGGGVVEYNQPVSLLGYSARMQIKRKVTDDTPLLTLSSTNGGIVLDTTYSTITLKATAEQTAGLNFTSAIYDLELISSGGDVYRFAEGSISLKQEVTK